MKTFAQLVKEAREDAGLTMTALAEKSGVSKATVSRIEGGQRHADLLSVALLVQALDMPQWTRAVALMESAAQEYGTTVAQIIADLKDAPTDDAPGI